MKLTEAIVARIKEIYSQNGFMHHCGIEIHNISCGKAAVGLRIQLGRDTNLNNKLHGGLLMTIMDNATGIACASLGKRAVTVSMTVDFIKSADVGSLVEAEAVVTNVTNGMMYLNIRICDKDHDKLLATGISTLMIIADFPGIPEEW